jgi:hypothetical protein
MAVKPKIACTLVLSALLLGCARQPARVETTAAVHIDGFVGAAGQLTPIEPCARVRMEAWVHDMHFGPEEVPYEQGSIALGNITPGQATIRVSRLNIHNEAIDFSEERLDLAAGPNRVTMPAFQKEWTDPAIGMRIGYPAGWNEVHTVSAPVVMAIQRPVQSVEPSGQPRVRVEVEPGGTLGVRDALSERLRAAFPDATIGTPDMVVIAGKQCAEIVFDVDIGGDIERRQYIFTSHNDRRICIELGCRASLFAGDQAIREEMIHIRDHIDFFE